MFSQFQVLAEPGTWCRALVYAINNLRAAGRLIGVGESDRHTTVRRDDGERGGCVVRPATNDFTKRRSWRSVVDQLRHPTARRLLL